MENLKKRAMFSCLCIVLHFMNLTQSGNFDRTFEDDQISQPPNFKQLFKKRFTNSNIVFEEYTYSNENDFENQHELPVFSDSVSKYLPSQRENIIRMYKSVITLNEEQEVVYHIFLLKNDDENLLIFKDGALMNPKITEGAQRKPSYNISLDKIPNLKQLGIKKLKKFGLIPTENLLTFIS